MSLDISELKNFRILVGSKTIACWKQQETDSLCNKILNLFEHFDNLNREIV